MKKAFCLFTVPKLDIGKKKNYYRYIMHIRSVINNLVGVMVTVFVSSSEGRT